MFQGIIRIPMGTKCALLLAYLFLHAYCAEFPQGIENYTKTFIPPPAIEMMVCHWSILNSVIICMPCYPNKFETMDTILTIKTASYLDLHLEFSHSQGQTIFDYERTWWVVHTKLDIYGVFIATRSSKCQNSLCIHQN